MAWGLPGPFSSGQLVTAAILSTLTGMDPREIASQFANQEFFIRVRPDSVTKVTDALGATFKGVELTHDVELPGKVTDFERGLYPQGFTFHGALGEEQAEQLEATGLFERVDKSFVAVRIRDEAMPPLGTDLSNDRVLGVVDELVPPAPRGTDAQFMLHQLAAHLAASNMDEQTFRDRLRADPRFAVYADAEFPELRFYISRLEAFGLIADDDAEPIYAGDEDVDDALTRLLGD